MHSPPQANEKKIVIVAGEASGDMHAAGLIHGLKKIRPNIQVTAMGGDKLRHAGAEILVDYHKLAVVGIVEILRHYPDIKRALNQLESHLIQQKPDLLILVDYVEFNLRLAKKAKALGIQVLFYISPQVWAWRQGRVKKIGQVIDMMAVIFPFELAFYHRYQIPVRYVGNPLVGKVAASRPRLDNFKTFHLDPEKPVIGLQPGSRRSEITRLLPLYLNTARLLKATLPDIQFVLPVAPGITHAWIHEQIPDDLNITLIENESAYDVMNVCTAILTASGTATLETALMGVPMVVAYQVAPLSYAIMKRLIKIPFISLVNIIAQKQVIQEFVQQQATPEVLVEELLKLLGNPDYRQTIKTGLNEVKQKLGTTKGSDAIAELADEMLAGKV